MTITATRDAELIASVADLLDRSRRHEGYGAPKGYRVSRCHDCGRAYTWKGAAPRPACPACGGALSTTTRMLKAVPFIELHDRLLDVAEVLPNGLAAEAAWHDNRARDYDERVERLEAEAAKLLAAGDAEVGEDGLTYRLRVPAQWEVERHGYEPGKRVRGMSMSPYGLRAAAEKHRAKAAGCRRRLARVAKRLGVTA